MNRPLKNQLSPEKSHAETKIHIVSIFRYKKK